MTRATGEKVTLERRDWFAAAALALSLFAAVGGLYLSISESLVEVRTCQKSTTERLERMEGDILRLEARIFRELP